MLSAIAFLTVGALLARANEDQRLKRYFMALAVFLTVAVGVSCVYLAVHYPTDVLAGWCIGSGWQFFVERCIVFQQTSLSRG